MIRIDSVSKSFTSGEETVQVLSGASFSLPDGAFYAITGPSGSGKSTLLNLAAGLVVPDSGSVFFDDTDIAKLDEDARTRFRGKHLAFVFQQFHLVPNLTVEENVLAIGAKHKAEAFTPVIPLHLGLDGAGATLGVVVGKHCLFRLRNFHGPTECRTGAMMVARADAEI